MGEAGLMLGRISVKDENLITLLARALKVGVIVDGEIDKTTRGCPQGSLLSLHFARNRSGHRVRQATQLIPVIQSNRHVVVQIFPD